MVLLTVEVMSLIGWKVRASSGVHSYTLLKPILPQSQRGLNTVLTLLMPSLHSHTWTMHPPIVDPGVSRKRGLECCIACEPAEHRRFGRVILPKEGLLVSVNDLR